jgi:hypothetical protein
VFRLLTLFRFSCLPLPNQTSGDLFVSCPENKTTKTGFVAVVVCANKIDVVLVPYAGDYFFFVVFFAFFAGAFFLAAIVFSPPFT